jgi:hypothetical protein
MTPSSEVVMMMKTGNKIWYNAMLSLCYSFKVKLIINFSRSLAFLSFPAPCIGNVVVRKPGPEGYEINNFKI